MILSETEMHIDIVFCIDGSKWMKPPMDACKEAIVSLREQIEAAGADFGHDLGSLRAKTIVFRNYACDEDPMVISPWYDLFEEQSAFQDHVRAIDAHGGGDTRCISGIEALYSAVNQDFRTDPVVRQIIILFSNCDIPWDLPEARPNGYPEGLVNLGSLIDAWAKGPKDPERPKDRLTRHMCWFVPNGTKYELLPTILAPHPACQTLSEKLPFSRIFTDIVKIIYTHYWREV